MKKSSTAAISIMGTVGGLLLAIGMCMCLLPAWNAVAPGAILSVLGAVTLAAIWPVSRKASGKAVVHLTGGSVAAILLGLAGAAALGVGVFHCLQVISAFGLAVGIAGLALLLAAVLVGRRAAGKRAVPFNGRRVLACVVGIAGTLTLGFGMCLIMVWGSDLMIPGILAGCAGLLVCVLNLTMHLAKGAHGGEEGARK